MTDLSKQIREGTKKSHTMAENTGFITCFLKGVVEKKSYIRLLSDLYFIYSAMEEEFENHKSDTILRNIYYPELFRKKSLEKDLQYYLGIDWRDLITQTKSCKEYVARISEIANGIEGADFKGIFTPTSEWNGVLLLEGTSFDKVLEIYKQYIKKHGAHPKIPVAKVELLFTFEEIGYPT